MNNNFKMNDILKIFPKNGKIRYSKLIKEKIEELKKEYTTKNNENNKILNDIIILQNNYKLNNIKLNNNNNLKNDYITLIKYIKEYKKEIDSNIIIINNSDRELSIINEIKELIKDYKTEFQIAINKFKYNNNNNNINNLYIYLNIKKNNTTHTKFNKLKKMYTNSFNSKIEKYLQYLSIFKNIYKK